MEQAWNHITQLVSAYIPNLIGALTILIVGWLVAVVVAALLRGALRRTGLADRLAGSIGGAGTTGRDVDRWAGKGAFYLIMLFVLVAFFEALRLTLITEPINRFLSKTFAFGPQVLAAGLLGAVAWVVATVLRMLLLRGLAAARLDERLGSQVGGAEGRPMAVSHSLADAVYWLVFLLFLPAILGALALEGLLQPVQEMMNQILGFLPSLFAAGVILGVGWCIARIVQRIVTNLLVAVGADRLSDRVGLAPVLGTQRLSGILGLLVYIVILIPVLTAALNALALDAITQPASNMLNMMMEAIPAIFAAVALVALAYMVGRVVSGLLSNLLSGVGFDGVMARLGLARETAEGTKTPSALAGTLVLVAVMLFATTEAFQLLGFEALGDLLAEFLVFAGHILVGLVIFALGLYLANLASRTVLASGAAQAGLLAMAARLSIIVLSGAMALRQMGLANEIVVLTFGLLLGAVAVAVAIAFGLGGRDLAARQLSGWTRSIRSGDS